MTDSFFLLLATHSELLGLSKEQWNEKYKLSTFAIRYRNCNECALFATLAFSRAVNPNNPELARPLWLAASRVAHSGRGQLWAEGGRSTRHLAANAILGASKLFWVGVPRLMRLRPWSRLLRQRLFVMLTRDVRIGGGMSECVGVSGCVGYVCKNVDMCAYVYMLVNVWVCMCVDMCVYLLVCVGMCEDMFVYVCGCMCARMCVGMCV